MQKPAGLPSNANFWARYQANGHSAEELAHLVTADPSPLVRLEAVRSLEGLHAVQYADCFASALEDQEMIVRRAAIKALVSLRCPLSTHVRVLATRLDDEFWPVRLWASKGLGTVGDVAQPFAGKLANVAMLDEHMAVREEAAKAWGNLGDAAVPHVERLCQQLVDCAFEERERGCIALAHALSAPDITMRQVVANGFSMLIDRADQKVVNNIKQHNNSGKVEACEREIVNAVSVALLHEDLFLRKEAIETLFDLATRTN